MKSHLEAFERATGKKHPLLVDAPTLPKELDYLWSDFMDLSSSRSSNGFGPSRITFADIDAWQRVNGVALQPWEIDLIRAADNEFLSSKVKAS